jgi:hypothetical protein
VSAALATLTVAGTGQQWQRLAGVAGRFGLTPDPVDADAATMMVVRPDPVRQAGIVQGLQDLGYLPERVAGEGDAGFDRRQLDAALAAWRGDTVQLSATYRPSASGDAPDDGVLAARGLDLADPLPVLLMQTSFAGELQLYRLPSPGAAPSLLSRVLQFRMKTFNRYGGQVGAPLTAASLDTFRRMKTVCGFADSGDLAFLNHLGNISKLGRRFSESYRKRVFVYRDPAAPPSGRMAGDYAVDWPTRRVRRGRRYVRVPDKRKPPVLRWRAAGPDGRPLTDLDDSEVNTLGLELLQLLLWQHGYYTGAVDADWGAMSREALDDFLGSCSALHGDPRQLRDLVAGGYVLNLAYLLVQLFPAAERSVADMHADELEQVAEDVFPRAADDPDWPGLRRQADRVLREDGTAFVARRVTTRRQGHAPGTFRQTHRRRRLNLGWSGIKAAIGGWFRRFRERWDRVVDVVKAVAAKVREFVLKGARSVVSMFRFALTRLKRALRIATAAVRRLYHWVAGRPFGTGDPSTGHFVVSRWSIDFDTVNYCAAGCRPAVIRQHLGRIAFMNASFHYMLTVALAALEIAVNVAMQNWLRVAHLVYRALSALPEWSTANDPYRAYIRAVA